MCLVVPKKGRPCSLLEFLAEITGSCQKPHLDSEQELFFTAWPCLYPCKYFKAFIYHVDIRKQGRIHRREKSWTCKQYGKAFRHQNCLQFQEKKILFHLFVTEDALKQINCLLCSLNSDGGCHSNVVCILELLEQVLKCSVYVANSLTEVYLVVHIFLLSPLFIFSCALT